MNLHRLCSTSVNPLANPSASARIGAGKFGSMYLSRVKHTPGIHLLAVADLDPARARRRS